MNITAERLRDVLRYNPETGVFVWTKAPRTHPRLLGVEAGSRTTGYVMIRVDGRRYKAHRLAWLYVHGSWPAERIDHRDGNPFNNTFSNLRLATQAQNCANAALKRGKQLPKGVRKIRNKYQARISFEKRLIFLGSFGTAEQAASAYAAAANRLYGEFARTA